MLFYSRYVYHALAAARRVDSQAEWDALGPEWCISPDAATEYAQLVAQSGTTAEDLTVRVAQQDGLILAGEPTPATLADVIPAIEDAKKREAEVEAELAQLIAEEESLAAAKAAVFVTDKK